MLMVFFRGWEGVIGKEVGPEKDIIAMSLTVEKRNVPVWDII